MKFYLLLFVIKKAGNLKLKVICLVCLVLHINSTMI